jgi:hypothetical protein
MQAPERTLLANNIASSVFVSVDLSALAQHHHQVPARCGPRLVEQGPYEEDISSRTTACL